LFSAADLRRWQREGLTGCLWDKTGVLTLGSLVGGEFGGVKSKASKLEGRNWIFLSTILLDSILELELELTGKFVDDFLSWHSVGELHETKKV